MTSFERTATVCVSPQEAAERLTDIAYALIAGGRLQLTVDRGRVTVPLGDELRMRHDLTSDGACVRLELQLSWSAGGS
jgi:amphi-Trp domain-containing protein